MSLHYIIDGYNLMKQFTNITGKRISGSREEFIKLLLFFRPFGSLHNQVTVVFDGYSDTYPANLGSNINVIFSNQESADEKIVKMVSSCKNSKCIIVVTDDKQIKLLVKPKIHKVMFCKDFMERASRLRDSNKKNISDEYQESCEKSNFSKTQASQITKELERIWLDKKADDKE